MLKTIIKFIKKIFLEKLKRDFDVKNFSDLNFISMWYTFKLFCILGIPITLYLKLNELIYDYTPLPIYYNDIPSEISVLFNKSYDDITWEEINAAKDFLANKSNLEVKNVEIIEPIKSNKLILFEFISKIIRFYFFILISIIIAIILSRDLIKNKIKKIINYITVFISKNITIYVSDKKTKKEIIILIFIGITVELIINILKNYFFNMKCIIKLTYRHLSKSYSNTLT